MPQPIYLPPPQDPFTSILPFAMRLYEMKQRKDIAEAELSQRKEERAATAKTHEETLRAGMMQHGFEAVPREEAQDQNMPSGQAVGGLNWRRQPLANENEIITKNGVRFLVKRGADGRAVLDQISEPEKDLKTIEAKWIRDNPNATEKDLINFKRSIEKPTEHETWGKPYKEDGQVFQQSNRGQVRKITGDQADTIKKWNIAAKAAGLDPEKVAKGDMTPQEAQKVLEQYGKANGIVELLKALGVGGEETQGGTTSLKFDAQGKPIK